ncbi:hypothetical protein ACWCQK_40815 [Streptomyces sp. NPDC002306]
MSRGALSLFATFFFVVGGVTLTNTSAHAAVPGVESVDAHVLDTKNNCFFTVGVGSTKEFGTFTLIANVSSDAKTGIGSSYPSCEKKYGTSDGAQNVLTQMTCSNSTTSAVMTNMAYSSVGWHPFDSQYCDARFRVQGNSGPLPGVGWGTEYRWHWEKGCGWASAPYEWTRTTPAPANMCNNTGYSGVGVMLQKPNGTYEHIWHTDLRNWDSTPYVWGPGNSHSGFERTESAFYKAMVDIMYKKAAGYWPQPDSRGNIAPEFRFVTYSYGWGMDEVKSHLKTYLDDMAHQWPDKFNRIPANGALFEGPAFYAGCWHADAYASAAEYPGMKDHQIVQVQGFQCLNQHPGYYP